MVRCSNSRSGEHLCRERAKVARQQEQIGHVDFAVAVQIAPLVVGAAATHRAEGIRQQKHVGGVHAAVQVDVPQPAAEDLLDQDAHVLVVDVQVAVHVATEVNPRGVIQACPVAQVLLDIQDIVLVNDAVSAAADGPHVGVRGRWRAARVGGPGHVPAGVAGRVRLAGADGGGRGELSRVTEEVPIGAGQAVPAGVHADEAFLAVELPADRVHRQAVREVPGILTVEVAVVVEVADAVADIAYVRRRGRVGRGGLSTGGVLGVTHSGKRFGAADLPARIDGKVVQHAVEARMDVGNAAGDILADVQAVIPARRGVDVGGAGQTDVRDPQATVHRCPFRDACGIQVGCLEGVADVGNGYVVDLGAQVVTAAATGVHADRVHRAVPRARTGIACDDNQVLAVLRAAGDIHVLQVRHIDVQQAGATIGDEGDRYPGDLRVEYGPGVRTRGADVQRVRVVRMACVAAGKILEFVRLYPGPVLLGVHAVPVAHRFAVPC